MVIEITGIGSLLLLIADIYALINVVQSPRVSTGGKVAWVLAIILLPLLGFIVWLLFGPRSPKAS